jgi:hypothetical protein
MDFLNRKFPENWLAEAGLSLGHLVLLTLFPLIFFFWGYVQGAVYVLPLAITLLELAREIGAAVATLVI